MVRTFQYYMHCRTIITGATFKLMPTIQKSMYTPTHTSCPYSNELPYSPKEEAAQRTVSSHFHLQKGRNHATCFPEEVQKPQRCIISYPSVHVRRFVHVEMMMWDACRQPTIQMESWHGFILVQHTAQDVTHNYLYSQVLLNFMLNWISCWNYLISAIPLGIQSIRSHRKHI